MTDPNPDQNAPPEAIPGAPQSVVEPLASEVPEVKETAPEPAPEPVAKAPEVSDPETEETFDPASKNDDLDLDLDAAEVSDEFAGKDHPSKQPVASRPAPAGPSSQPPDRVARAREEN